MLLGTYEPKGTPWKVDGTPSDFGNELLPPDLDRIGNWLEMSFERIPPSATLASRTSLTAPSPLAPMVTR